jgi:hypothetical protein
LAAAPLPAAAGALAAALPLAGVLAGGPLGRQATSSRTAMLQKATIFLAAGMTPSCFNLRERMAGPVQPLFSVARVYCARPSAASG